MCLRIGAAAGTHCRVPAGVKTIGFKKYIAICDIKFKPVKAALLPLMLPQRDDDGVPP